MPAEQFTNPHFEWEKLEFRKNYALLTASLRPACLDPEEEGEERYRLEAVLSREWWS